MRIEDSFFKSYTKKGFCLLVTSSDNDVYLACTKFISISIRIHQMAPNQICSFRDAKATQHDSLLLFILPIIQWASVFSMLNRNAHGPLQKKFKKNATNFFILRQHQTSPPLLLTKYEINMFQSGSAHWKMHISLINSSQNVIKWNNAECHLNECLIVFCDLGERTLCIIDIRLGHNGIFLLRWANNQLISIRFHYNQQHRKQSTQFIFFCGWAQIQIHGQFCFELDICVCFVHVCVCMSIGTMCT